MHSGHSFFLPETQIMLTRPIMLFAVVATGGFVAACATEDIEPLMLTAQGLFEPISDHPPVIEGIAGTAQQVELGKMLYFEPRLSRSHNLSCNTCHLVGLGGVDVGETSLGHEWQRGGRNAPTVLNAVYNQAQFWDGRAKALEEQAGGPIQNPIEMAITAEHAVQQLKGIPGYVSKFDQVYPETIDPVTFDNLIKAIAAFEATLITPNAPFDRYLKGNAQALTTGQKEGLQLFINKGCAGCHGGINVGGASYSPFGLVQKPEADILPPEDKGRFEVTRTENDEYVFKVPSLRNIELTAPYFHSGKVWDIRESVAIMGSSQLGVTLNEDEVNKIVMFLLSLTGDQPEVTFPILPPSVASTPRPEK